MNTGIGIFRYRDLLFPTSFAHVSILLGREQLDRVADEPECRVLTYLDVIRQRRRILWS